MQMLISGIRKMRFTLVIIDFYLELVLKLIVVLKFVMKTNPMGSSSSSKRILKNVKTCMLQK